MSTEVLRMLVDTRKVTLSCTMMVLRTDANTFIYPIAISSNIFKKSFFQGLNVENLGSFRAQIHLAGQDEWVF